MSYEVLARKWRPRSFDEMAGQEHVLKALINALEQQRLHHAYLFTGTRGVGKTTIARIFAKSLNCETGITSKPCGQCSTCQEIDAGHYVDLIEVDAASRTKVDETRELMDNVQYAPSRGRYKVYLIDEVHMFSNHSFNALLKTLEEPPPHVKFLLATTEPQKLPVTILSRCLQFNLKRLSLDVIHQHLETILKEEKLDFEPAAIKRIARAADGSMRDGLSILDQAIAFSAETLSDASVCEMLGVIEDNFLFDLVNALAANDAEALMQTVYAMAERSCDFIAALAELVTLLHRIALAQTVPGVIDDSLGDRDRVMALAGNLTKEDVQLYYQIALQGRRDIELAPDPQGGFEMLLLRMLAFRPAGADEVPVAEAPSSGQTDMPKSRPQLETTVKDTVKQAPPTTSVAAAPPVSIDAPWHDIISVLDITGLEKELVANCSVQSRDANSFVILLDNAHKHLFNKKREVNIQKALSAVLNTDIQLTINIDTQENETPAMREQRKQDEKQQQAEKAIQEDDVIRSLQETFAASVQQESIRPVK